MNHMHNMAFGSIFISTFKLCLLLTLFVSLFCVIRLRDSVSFPVLLMFIFYAFTIVILLIPGAVLMSQVYNISLKFRQYAVTNFCKDEQRKKEIIKRELNSLSVLKCNIGALYYMEGKAKLTLVDNTARCFVYFTHILCP